EMRKKETAYLLLNVPLCLVLFVVLIIFNEGLSYRYSNWNPSDVETITLIGLVTLNIDFILISLLRILTKRMIILTLLEVAIIYLVIFLSFMV
ncbi:MAG: hypothetical protein ABI405_04300, partial [Parafilimonas sp.]